MRRRSLLRLRKISFTLTPSHARAARNAKKLYLSGISATRLTHADLTTPRSLCYASYTYHTGVSER